MSVSGLKSFFFIIIFTGLRFFLCIALMHEPLASFKSLCLSVGFTYVAPMYWALIHTIFQPAMSRFWFFKAFDKFVSQITQNFQECPRILARSYRNRFFRREATTTYYIARQSKRIWLCPYVRYNSNLAERLLILRALVSISEDSKAEYIRLFSLLDYEISYENIFELLW